MKTLRVPFTFDGGSVGATSDEGRIAEQKIINTLVTNNGERVMRPSFGASSSALLFDITSRMEFADYKVDAVQELRSKVSGVEIIDIRLNDSFFVETSEPTVATISVIYRLPLGTVRVSTFNIAVPGQLVEDTLG